MQGLNLERKEKINMVQSNSDLEKAKAAAAEAGLEIEEGILESIWGDNAPSKKPYQYELRVDVLKAATTEGDYHSNLKGNDNIRINSKPKEQTADADADVNLFYIQLDQIKNNSDWWKSITCHKHTGIYLYEMVTVSGETRCSERLTHYKDMLSYFIVLSKAGILASHTNVYWIKNSYDLKPDRDWFFHWEKDW